MEQTVEYAPASGVLSGIWLLVAIPLASAAILLLLGKRADKWGHWLGVAASDGGDTFLHGSRQFGACLQADGERGPFERARGRRKRYVRAA